MADRAVAGGGSTSLRGLRERMVAEAQAIAEERRSQSGVSSLATHSPNIRSAVKPVIDGSVLKNDIKQKLAKERREERKRQEEANKELQLLEKERKAKLQYEKHLEEKQRKLREQKEKDERRRISAEEKRKQKLEEERERYKAVLSRTLERSNRMDQRQKRWSWEGLAMMNSENKPGKTENKRSSSLNRRDSKMHSSDDTGHVEDKPAHSFPNTTPENSLISRLLIPTIASVARSKSAASLSIPGKESPAVNKKYIPQYGPTPLRSHSSEELKTSSMHCKSTAKTPPDTKAEVTPLEKVETTLKAKVKVPPTPSSATSREELPKVKLDTTRRASVDRIPTMSSEATPEVNVDLSSVSTDATPGVSGMASTSSVSSDIFPEVSIDTSSEVSEETSPLTSVDVSPVVSLDTSPEVSTDASPVESVDFSPEGSIEASLEGVQVLSEASVEAGPKASVKESRKESEEDPPKVLVEASPQANVEEPPKEPPKKPEMNKQTTNPVIKKRPAGNIPRYKWPSSPTKERRPPSPITTVQNQKNRPPSPSPVLKQSQTPLSYKIVPVQRTLLVPNALGTFKKKREIVSKTANEFEAVSQKHMIHEDSGNKSTPGTMSAEEATKILAEKRRLAREQKDKKEEERLQKEVEQRKVADAAKRVDEAQVEQLSKCEDRPQEKETEKSRGPQPQEYQGTMQQKGEAKIKAHEEADKRKKEHERIMLQNLQERLERKKRIEEIMKRTRKTDTNVSKATRTSGNDTTEEDEADEEGDTGSDEDSLDGVRTSGIGNNGDSSTKLTMPCENATRTPQKLVLLQAKTSEVNEEQTSYFNGDMKTFRQQDPKDPSNHAEGSRPSTERTSTCTDKSGKAREAATSTQPTQSVITNQDWICNQAFDFAHHNTALPATESTRNSHSHNLRDSMPTHQSPQTPSDHENRSKPVSP
ncbi:MAP7 domain-containing protein 3 [Octodon degus]|uniref:MAP7 domain-containing protein 3 n=1 Tax=Octodon degus TaxID=10160 RepID=A0A6P6DHC2_OCTDE|nr:MAP7 domain-containing protein 3 [Octodon degus]